MTRRPLRVLLVGGPMYDPLYRLLEEFSSKERVPVEVVAKLPHPELNARVAGDFSSGQADYDLISTHTKYAPSQARWLSPLEDSEIDLGSFQPHTLELARLDGALLSVPRNLDVKLLIYRSDLLSAPPATWRELRDKAAALSRRPARFGFLFPGKESGLFGHFFELTAMAGGQLFPDPRVPAPRAATEASRWALKTLVALQAEAAPRSTPRWHYDQVAACFLHGQAAMTTDWPGSWYLYRSAPRLAGRLGVSLYPEGPAGRWMYSSCHSFAVPKTARDRPAALALLRYLTSLPAQLLEARLGSLPARLDALERVTAEAEGQDAQRWGLLAEAAVHLLVPPKHHNYPAVEEVIWRQARSALQGKISVDTALAAIDRLGGRAARRQGV